MRRRALQVGAVRGCGAVAGLPEIGADAAVIRGAVEAAPCCPAQSAGISPVEEAIDGEAGFLLVALVVVIFLLALFLTIAAPTMARSLERDKELESEHRAQEYVRAIHNYYLKFNGYPTSVEQLLSQNNQHFLRQAYKDPLTGGDYRLIHFGEAKTQVKGFFGEPLEGVAQGSLGALAGSASGVGTGVGGATTTGAAGAGTAGSGTGFSSGGFSLSGSSTSGAGASGSAGATDSSASGTAAPGTTGSGSTLGGTSATQFQGSKGRIVGVASTASGHGLVEWNGSATIEDWEFLYDHRTWLQRQRVSIFGGSAGANGGGSFGTLGSGTGLGSNTPSFGTGTGSGFGSGSGTSTGLGSTGTNSTGSTGTGSSSNTAPQQ